MVRKRCSESREVRGEGLVEATPLLLMRLTRRTILKLSRHSCMSARVDRGKCLTMCIAQPEKRTLSLCPWSCTFFSCGVRVQLLMECLRVYCNTALTVQAAAGKRNVQPAGSAPAPLSNRLGALAQARTIKYRLPLESLAKVCRNHREATAGNQRRRPRTTSWRCHRLPMPSMRAAFSSDEKDRHRQPRPF